MVFRMQMSSCALPQPAAVPRRPSMTLFTDDGPSEVPRVSATALSKRPMAVRCEPRRALLWILKAEYRRSWGGGD